jgi:hypothetical protein
MPSMTKYISITLFSLLAGLASGVLADSPTTSPTSMPTTAPVAIDWSEAKDHVGDLAVVTGPVMGNHDFGGAVVLNVGKDFPDRRRFTVFINKENRAGIADDLYAGKTISVTGKIKLYHRVPEIEADGGHISVVSGSTTVPATQP